MRKFILKSLKSSISPVKSLYVSKSHGVLIHINEKLLELVKLWLKLIKIHGKVLQTDEITLKNNQKHEH